MRASVLLLLCVAAFSVGLAHPTTFQCSRYCKEDWSKFGYEVGSSYQYNYNGIIKTTVNASAEHGANAQTRLQFDAQVQISVQSACDYVMHISKVKIHETYINKDTVTRHTPDNSKELQAALTKHPLYFSFQNGRIDTVCPSEEDRGIIHIKKSILSAFQNSMPNLEENSIVYETDISGNCETQYQVQDSVSNLVIKKIKNLEACSHRKSRYLSWLSVPHYKNADKKSISLLRSTQTCTQTFNADLILQSTGCLEEHLFRPFSNGDNGAVTYLIQNLEFVAKTSVIPQLELPKNFHHTSLLYDHDLYDDIKSRDISSVKATLNDLERKTTDGVDPDVPRLFSQLVHELQTLDQNSMTNIFHYVKKSSRKKKFLLDAMPLITTVQGITSMKALYNQKEITDSQMNSWLTSLTFMKDVSLPIIKAITPLAELNNSIKQKSILTTSTLVYIYCKDDAHCLDRPEIQEVVQIVQRPLEHSCTPSSPENHNEILLAIKALGNLGISSSQDYLRNCYSNDDSPMELRLAAIAAHRRINCAENDNLEQFEDYFADVHQNTEIRIASYLAVLQCASYATFARVKDVLRNEETNQVGSFVWTHLTNLQESSSQWKQNLKSLVENEFLRNKFSTDMRKYSRNYEVSTFFDSLNTGATVESNVVFTSESYLPKSAMLNFTLDLFGEAVNIFEVGARIEGFEQVIENLFGPEGYFPEESIRNALENVRSNHSQDKIQELRSSFASQTTYKDPTGLLYAKIFGNEISYTHFKDLEGLIGGAINGRTILDALMKLFMQQDIDYTKSFVFLDSSYKIPTLLGFPLELAINGTATVGLTVKGKMDLKDLWAQRIAVEGKIYPSAAVEIIGSMTVDTSTSKIGLRSVNTFNSNTYLDGHAFINKGKLVDLKLNVPKKEMNIINVESQIFLLQSDIAYPIDDVTDNVENWQGCSPKMFGTVTGLEVCYEMRYVNASMSSHAPYFPLTGKFKYSMNVKKKDVFDSYQLHLRTHTEMRNYRPVYSMSFYFDTPNSKIDRKMKTSYLLDCENLILNATLASPFINLEINSRIGDDSDNLGFVLQTKLNNNEILLTNMSLKSEKIGDRWKYEPLAILNYKKEQLLGLSGTVNYLQGAKYSADLKFEGLADEPILVAGDLHLGAKKFQLVSSIKSKNLNGNARATVIKKPESFSITAKTTYDYKDLKRQVLDIEFSQHTLMRDTVSEEKLYVSVNSTQKPLYNTLLSVTIKRDRLYFESRGLLALFGETWDTHQLFKFVRLNGYNDIALQCSLRCLQKHIDYAINLAHVKSSNVFKVHGLLQLNKVQRLEGLVDYSGITDKNRTLDILIYYPNQSWNINGIFNRKTEKDFNVFIQSFYEFEDQKTPLVVISGEYNNSTIAHFQNHTITGVIEIPESNGALNTPWIISSSLQISPDLFLNTIQLRAQNDLYIAHMTWTKESFSTLLQINDRQLFAMNGMKNAEELNLLVGLNIYQHFELSTKLVMPYKTFNLILYWDKDRDIHDKIALYIDRQMTKGLYLVDLEYPHQKVSASFILLPSQVTMNVTWGIDSSQRIYLKAGNKIYDIGGIWFAKLETPFKYLENQEFKLSYYILPQNAELKVDVAWRDQKIAVLMSGIKSATHISANLDVNTTIPEISKVSVAVSHSHNTTEDMLKIKNDAVFVFNEHQIMGQSIWQSRGTNISSRFEIVSASNIIMPITGALFVSNNHSANYLSGFVSWRNKKISIDYKFKNSQSYIKIKTPFKGLEVTELDYTLIAEAEKLLLEVRINLLSQFNYALLSWNNEGQTSEIKLEITCPIIGTYKILLKHSTVFGHLEEYLIITQGNNTDIVAVELHGDLVPVLLMDLTASVKFLEHKASLAIKNIPNPIKFTLEAKWNQHHITSVLVAVLEKKEIKALEWNVSSTFLDEDLLCRYLQNNTSYVVTLTLPKGYKFNNVLNIEHSYKVVENVLNVETPVRSGSLRYFHDLGLNGHNFDHQLVFKMNDNESRFALNYNLNDEIPFIDTAFMQFMTPWHYPITLNFSMPHESPNIWKPSVYLEYDNKKVMNIESTVKIEHLSSEMHVLVDLPFTVPFKIDAMYNFAKPVKAINILVFEEDTFLNITSQFFLEDLQGWFSLSTTITDLEGQKDIVAASLRYDVRDSYKTATLSIAFPEQQHQMKFEASTTAEKNVRKANLLLLSTVPNWEKLFLGLSVGLSHDESYVTIGKNDKSLTVKYTFDKLYKDGSVACSGKIILTSSFEIIKNGSLGLTYTSSDTFQDMYLEIEIGTYTAFFKGNYELTNQTSKGVQFMSLNSVLSIKLHRNDDNNVIDLFNINAKMKGSIEVKKSSGKINAIFNSNIPNLEHTKLDANYDLSKKGHEVTAALMHNKDYYSIQHHLDLLPNKYEFSVNFYTPTKLYGNISTILTSIKETDSVKTELRFERNLKQYNISVSTKYDSLLSSDTVIKITTPDKGYTGGIKGNLSLAETNVKLYAIIDGDFNQGEFLMKFKNYRKLELQTHVDLVTLRYPSWTLNGKYDFSSTKRTLAVRLRSNSEHYLEVTLDKHKIHVKADIPTVKSVVIISGSHKLNDINDLSISYAIYFNDQKIKIDLANKVDIGRTTSLDVFTTFKEWNRIAFMNTMYDGKFEVLIDLKGYTVVAAANKNALFNDEELLTIDFNKTPIVAIWSGREKSYLTSSSVWGDYKAFIDYIADPRMYAFTVLQDGKELLNLVVEDIHTKTYFDFKTRIHTPFFPKYSNLTAYFYTDYEVPNEFRFTLQNGAETITSLAYNFQLKEEHYQATFNFNSRLEALQAFSVSFNFDPQFFLEFKILKTQFDVKQLYQFSIGLPFHSDESQLEVSFPWEDKYFSVSLLLKQAYIDFQLKTPLENWSEACLKANFKKVDRSVKGLLKLQKNNAHAVADWFYGYDRNKIFVNVNIKHTLSSEKWHKVIIDGKLITPQKAHIFCDIEEFGNEIKVDYLSNYDGTSLATYAVLPDILIENLELNATLVKLQELNVNLKINNYTVLNAVSHSSQPFFNAHVSICENNYYYNVESKWTASSYPWHDVVVSLNSKTDSYLLDVKSAAQISPNLFIGNIDAVIEQGWAFEPSTSNDSYAIRWSIQRKYGDNTIGFSCKRNDHLTYIFLDHHYIHNKLKTNLTIGCGGKDLNLFLEGTVSPELSYAVCSLTTPLKELSQINFETSLAHINGKYEFRNILLWPDHDPLILNLNTYLESNETKIGFKFSSPFSKSIQAYLNYTFNDGAFEFYSGGSINNDEILLKAKVIPSTYISTQLTLPIIVYKSLNFTAVFDMESGEAKLYLETELLKIDCTGTIDISKNNIYSIIMHVNDQYGSHNSSQAEVVIRINTTQMSGHAKMFWKDLDIQIVLSYDPKKMFLDIATNFKKAKRVRLDGQYFITDVNTHNLQASGVWDDLPLSFSSSLTTQRKNLTVESQIKVGDNYHGRLNIRSTNIDNDKAIHFNAYFPNKKSQIDLTFLVENRMRGTKASLSLVTPFETIKSITAETVTERGHIEAKLMVVQLEQTLKSEFKSVFKTSTQVETSLIIDVPQIDSKWEVEVDIDIYERGVLRILYDIADTSNSAQLDYHLIDSVFFSRFSMNGTKANVSHVLDIYLNNAYNTKEYGVVLDEYMIKAKFTNKLYYNIEGTFQVHIPYWDIESDLWAVANLLDKKVTGKYSYNEYKVDFEGTQKYATINAVITFDFGKHISGIIDTKVEMLQEGLFLKSNISDTYRESMNSTLIYTNNKHAIVLDVMVNHMLLQNLAYNFHLSKSLDKIFVNIENIFKLDIENTPVLSKLHVYKDIHNLKLDFRSSNFSLHINSPIFVPENLELVLGWSSKTNGKQLDFRYSELNNSVLTGIVDFNYNKQDESTKEYILTTNAYGYDNLVLDFSGRILITNVTQGFASVEILNKKSHAYFLLSPSDPYLAGLTVGSPFLPYGGFTLETGTSVGSTSIFVFAGSGPSDLLSKGFINLESHEKYILFEARREGKTIFVKYEAPAISWLKLVDLQAGLDIEEKHIKFFESLEVQSDLTADFSINSKFNVEENGIETEIHMSIPFFDILPRFNAELHIPFSFNNNFNPKVLIELPNIIYSAQLTYKYQQNNRFIISGGYQYDTHQANAIFQLENYQTSPIPTLFVELNLPCGQYKHFALSLKRQRDLNNEFAVLSYLDILNTRSELNYTIAYKRDRQLLKVSLVTPFKFYEKFSFNLDFQNTQDRKLKAMVFFPSLPQECGFDFGISYRNIREFKLEAKVALPVEIHGFGYGEFIIIHNLNMKGHNKSHALTCFSKINNFNASFDLNTALTSDTVVFKLDTNIGSKRFFTNIKSLGNIFDNTDFVFELVTPLKIVQNVKVYLISSADLKKGIHTGIAFNSETLLQLDFIVENGNVFLKFDNIWKPLLAEYHYSYTDHLQASGKICWDMNYPEVSQFGGHVVIGRNFSVGLILPTRVMSIDTKYFIDKHNEYYFGRISWYKGKEVALQLSFVNSTTNDVISLKSSATLTLPFRTFQIIDEVEANYQQSPAVKSKFTFKWDKNDTSQIFLQNHIIPGKLESRFYIPILEHEIVLKLDMSSLTKIPSYVKAQLEYSSDIDKRLEFEMYYNKMFSENFKTERRFVVKHPASKIDYMLHFSTTRTPEFTSGNITLQYMNYFLNRHEQIRSSLKISHEKLEVAGDIETSKNQLSVIGASKSGMYFQGFVATMQLNKKEPLIAEGTYNFKPTGSSLSFTTSYGNSRKYDFYAGLPSKREITTKLVHTIYDAEIVDWLFTVKLNSSQILWLKLNWKNEFLPQFHSIILEEYNDLRFIVEATGHQLIDLIEDDFGQTLFNDASKLQNDTSYYAKQEKQSLREDYTTFLNEAKDGYKSNAFYLKDIQQTAKTLFPHLDVFETMLLRPIWDFIELLYKGAAATINDVHSSVRGIFSTIQLQVEYSIKEVRDIKKLKLRAREILKNGINEAREALKQLDVHIAGLMDSIDEYVTTFKQQCEEFFEPYLKLMDDFVIYIEQRLAILQMLVLDVLDTVQHYILNLRESREILEVYALYLNWLEEVHITDVLEPIGDVIEAILDTIITDIKKVMDDYRPYVDALSEAVFGNYQDLNKLPPLAEFREKFNHAYQRTLWIWNYHNLSESIKNSIHKLIADFDDYLASLIKVDDTGNDFENVLGQSDYIFRPEIGLIEITQPLPVEWEAFDEMPYFEQHPLYNKIKKRTENLLQLQRHHFGDILNTINSYIGKSPEILLSPPTNNIAMISGKSHYITFDKKYYNFAGDCNYLLASDFVTKTFSVLINYHLVNGTSQKKSISIINAENNLEISPDFTVTLNNAEIDLPLIVGSLKITREHSQIVVENFKGLKVVCNLFYDYCTVELSGWLFGKTGGLLGTLDNEKITDMSLPDGDRTSDLLEFVQSWQVGTTKCTNINYVNDTTRTNVSPLSTTLFETLCQVFFVNANSPLGHCFSRVDPKPFYEMCVNNMKDLVNPTMCSSVGAYKAQCAKSNIHIEMPEMCVHCKRAIGLTEEIFDRDNPKSIDVVIIKESACFSSTHDFSLFPNQVEKALENRGFTDNRFAVVGYGGSIGKPFVYTVGKQIWTMANKTAIKTELNSNTDSQAKESAIDAILFASNLDFRPGISKIFILMQCDYYTEYENLNSLHTMFGEKDITLHVLKMKPLNNSAEELLELNTKGHVLHIQPSFNIQNLSIENMNSTITQGMPDQITDIYSLLALSTNGTVLCINDEKHHENDQISIPWAEVISHTAKRSPCQRCKCVTNPDGSGKVECTRCMSPIVKQLLNEYESNIMEFHTDQNSDEYV